MVKMQAITQAATKATRAAVKTVTKTADLSEGSARRNAGPKAGRPHN